MSDDKFPLSAHPDVVIPALEAKVRELEDRLEVYGTSGNGEKFYIGIGDCDGIGCRNETIKLLDEKVAKLTKWRDELLVERDALKLQLRQQRP